MIKGNRKRKREDSNVEGKNPVNKVVTPNGMDTEPTDNKTNVGSEKTKGEKNMADEERVANQATLKKNGQFSRNLLQVYYNTLFPYEHLFSWLNYRTDEEVDPEKEGHPRYWKKREICFTMEGDIFVRYQSFHTMKEFKTALKKQLPFKIDIGPVYNVEPRKKKTSCVKLQAEEKELVFDIDITDYDDVRNCCSGGACCSQCWPLMTCAIKVLEYILTNVFGFKNKLWVFSGRRGVHCWVCDPRVLKYTKTVRTSIIKFIHTYTGNDQKAIKVDLNTAQKGGIPHFYERCHQICEEYFRLCTLGTQDLFMLTNAAGVPYFKGMLEMIHDEGLRQEIADMLSVKQPTESAIVWKITSTMMDKYAKQFRSSAQKFKETRYAGEIVKAGTIPGLIRANKIEIIFSYVFPRVDIEVTKGVNHLLKSPFCAHPKTGKVCVPMDPAKIDDFDPEKQITLSTLYQELETNGWDPKKTSLVGALDTFERTFLNPLQAAYKSIASESPAASMRVG